MRRALLVPLLLTLGLIAVACTSAASPSTGPTAQPDSVGTLPRSSEPKRSCSASTQAEFNVAAPMAGSGGSPYKAAATATTSGIERQGDVPGLKSVASATMAPADRRSATGGGRARRNMVETGNRTAAVSAPPSARTPSLLT